MSNPEDLMGELNSLMSKAMGAQMVQDVVHAYDAYATAALKALVAQPGVVEKLSAAKVAEFAWDFADAMMDERKKRGIGGMSPQITDRPEPLLTDEQLTELMVASQSLKKD